MSTEKGRTKPLFDTGPLKKHHEPATAERSVWYSRSVARTTFSRQDLLPPLAEVFRRHGYEGATLSELARVTGLGKASLYHHFPGGKSEMAEALARYAIADLDERAFRHLKSRAPWNERIGECIDGFADYADA